MNTYTTYEELRERIGRGDHAAAVELQERLTRELRPVARTTLRTRQAVQPVTQLMLADIERLPRLPRAWRPDEEEGIISYLTRRASKAIVDHLLPAANTVPVYDTVCA